MPSSRMFNGLLLSVTSVTAQAREFEESKSADIATGVTVRPFRKLQQDRLVLRDAASKMSRKQSQTIRQWNFNDDR